jgi:hypothetical protein
VREPFLRHAKDLKDGLRHFDDVAGSGPGAAHKQDDVAATTRLIGALETSIEFAGLLEAILGVAPAPLRVLPRRSA